MGSTLRGWHLSWSSPANILHCCARFNGPREFGADVRSTLRDAAGPPFRAIWTLIQTPGEASPLRSV
jgi:hypothetical protein